MIRRLLLIVLLVSPAAADELTVFAAASLTNVLKELAPLYQQSSGNTLRFNFGGSGTLARQITEGAPADVFISADQLRADQLEKAGLILAGTRKILLANALVLIVNRKHPARITTAGDLATESVRRVAIGEPRVVPAGTYAKAWLESHHLWDAIAAKTIPLDNVRSVLAAVSAGNADAGIVYRTDASSSENVTMVTTLLPEGAFEISYPAAVLKVSDQPEAASALIDWLAGPQAQAIFIRHGFLSPE